MSVEFDTNGKVKIIQLNFKDVGSTATFEHPEFGEITVGVESYVVENDGIGSYECHGFRGFDKGRESVLVEEINLQEINGEQFDKTKHAEVEKTVLDMWNNCKLDANVDELPDDEPEPDYDDE